ncbi:HoxN/HupN/NixA family nickel/cobalt transporter [Cupriavidus plantarum]|uniref:Nickel/cobalt efflux system n=1 Tax=Cupriavidus plantarum TaxID=942865 RepID=A0A316ET03_9BURK|nr:HoxN/HupN/NixA family nickel/cobalt transporter [Cupriavidus plantarum]PWK34232.1 high-affinity nickel-transport protein [Cupriavidus plantarum]
MKALLRSFPPSRRPLPGRLFDDEDIDVRQKTAVLAALVLAGNVGAWIWAWIVFRGAPALFASALLAYTLGLRHAVDADHIAAIDNVTRKLMHEGRRPISVGFFFSLGHSTVVMAMSLGIALAVSALQSRIEAWKAIGGLIGTGASVLFLLILAVLNLRILLSAWRAYRAASRGAAAAHAAETGGADHAGGLMTRLLAPLLRLTRRSWHLYPVGLLFGLGFDTATEVALFGMSAAEATRGVPFWSVMVFPALFAAGMSLVDTLDGFLMIRAYGWALENPARKLRYNMTITSISVLVAVVIAGVESVGLLADKLSLHGVVWEWIVSLNGRLGMLGYIMIGVFGVGWGASVAVHRLCQPAASRADIRISSR